MGKAGKITLNEFVLFFIGSLLCSTSGRLLMADLCDFGTRSVMVRDTLRVRVRVWKIYFGPLMLVNRIPHARVHGNSVKHFGLIRLDAVPNSRVKSTHAAG